MYRISKKFEFSASHQLDHLPEGHQCKRLHGHNYVVTVIIESPCLDDRGFCMVDYGELAHFKTFIEKNLEHRHLNDVLPVRPTAENLARFLFDHLKPSCPFLKAVGVSETPKTYAEYSY